MPKQIGWSNESNLLYTISSQISRLAGIIATSGGGGGGGGTITGGGAAGQVTFWDAATNITGSNNFSWNNTNGRLNITAITTVANHRVGLAITSAATTRAYFDSTATGANWNTGFAFTASNVEKWSMAGFGTTFDFTIFNSGLNARAITFKGNTNNVLIGTDTDDNTNKLQVSGSTLLNGNVTFSSSTGMFWDAATSRLGIGTNTPTDPLTISYNLNSATGVKLTNSSTGVSARSHITLINDSGNQGNLSIWGTGTGLANKVLFESSKDFIIGTDSTVASGGTSKFQIYVGGYNAVSTPQLTLHATGNLSLGSTTDDNANKLQVSGSIKATGVGTFDAEVVTPRVKAPPGNLMLNVANGDRITVTLSQLHPNASQALGRNNLLTGHWGAIYGMSILHLTDNTTSSTTLNASAKMQLDSTTQGFLPPRMTETQRNAIASPAAGLTIFNTTVNDLEVYNGSVWVNDGATVITNRQATSFTLALTDRGKLVETNVGAANTITVPPNSSITFPIGTKIDIAQYGAGQTTIVPGIGVTVRSAGGALKLSAQYSGATIVKIGTDEWYLFGDITV
jgi:hypothetical protein